MHTMKTKPSSIRLFKNPILEKFTHVHPIMPLVAWCPVIIYLGLQTARSEELTALSITVLAFLGFFVWSFAEYCLHRFVFHFESKSAFGKRLIYMFHGVHHDSPDDLTRLVMPPAGSFIIGLGLFSLFRLFLGPVWVLPFFSAFIVGYLCYDYIHFLTHRYTPRNRIGKFIKQYHMNHHFLTPEAKWGVSSPLWDYVFGTVTDRSKTVNNLHPQRG